MTAARGDARPTTLRLIETDDSRYQAQALRQRADHLRRTSTTMHSLVAQAYRRRASELEFEAWLTDVRAGQIGGAAA
jgi:hypothetical protein